MSNAKLKTHAKAAMMSNSLTVFIIVAITWLLSVINGIDNFIMTIIIFLAAPFSSYLSSKVALYTMDGSRMNIGEAIEGFGFNYWSKIIVANLIIAIPSILFMSIAVNIILSSGIGFILSGIHGIYHNIDSSIIMMLGGAVLMILVLLIVELIATIVISLFFGLTKYIAIDYPELTVVQTLKKSIAMIKNNKKKLLFLELSFAPWIIGIIIVSVIIAYIPLLNILTSMISGLMFSFVLIYIDFTTAKFYMNICDMNENIEVEII